MMKGPRVNLDLERKLRTCQARIAWYHAMLIWTLNRCEHVPSVLVQLIRDKAGEYVLEVNAFDTKEEAKK